MNLTPHEIKISDRTIPPSGDVARVESDLKESPQIDGIPVRKGREKVVGLPQKEDQTAYVVSKPVERLVARSDVYAVDRLIRNPEGEVVGAEGLQQTTTLEVLGDRASRQCSTMPRAHEAEMGVQIALRSLWEE